MPNGAQRLTPNEQNNDPRRICRSCFLQGEPGDEIVRLALQSDHCMVTANQAEIIAKILDRGADAQAIKKVIDQLGFTVIDVTAKDGECAGWMRAPTRMIGSGLGDRSVLLAAGAAT